MSTYPPEGHPDHCSLCRKRAETSDKKTPPEPDPYLVYLQKEVWSRCGFCGARNGQHGNPVEQHRPRCRWRGNASDFSIMTPQYFKMIAEDDPKYLERYRAVLDLDKVQKELKVVKARLAAAELNSHPT